MVSENHLALYLKWFGYYHHGLSRKKNRKDGVTTVTKNCERMSVEHRPATVVIVTWFISKAIFEKLALETSVSTVEH